MKPRVRKALAWAGYPAFYLACLFVFAYLAFPYDRLRERIVVEFEKEQRAAGSAQRLEIDKLGGWRLTGLAAKGVRLIAPQPPGPDGPRPPTELGLDEVQARVSVLPLLLGRVKVAFAARAFGGKISGSVATSGGERRVQLEVEDVDLGRVEPVVALVGAPLFGTLRGKADLVLPEQKLAKASGTVEIDVAGFAAGDGKGKFGGKLALPRLDVGDLSLAAEAKEGALKVGKIAATGKDLELAGDGKMQLRDPPGESAADLYLRFKIAEAYKLRNEMTQGLFVPLSPTLPPAFEMADPRIKQARRADGFYAWHMTGPLRDPMFAPAPMGAAGPSPGGYGSPGGRPMPRGFTE